MEMGATEGFMKYQIEQLEEENKKLKEENNRLKNENISLHIEVEELRSTYIYDAKQVRDVC